MLRGRPDELPAERRRAGGAAGRPRPRHPAADGSAVRWCGGGRRARAAGLSVAGPATRPTTTSPAAGRCWPSPTPTGWPRPGAARPVPAARRHRGLGAGRRRPGRRAVPGRRRARRAPARRAHPHGGRRSPPTSSTTWPATRSSSTPPGVGPRPRRAAASGPSASSARLRLGTVERRARGRRGHDHRARGAGALHPPRRAAVDAPRPATLQARVGFLPRAAGRAWPDLSDAALRRSLDDWLAPRLAGATGPGRPRADRPGRHPAGSLGHRQVAGELDRLVPADRDRAQRAGGPPGLRRGRARRPAGAGGAGAGPVRHRPSTPAVAGGRVPVVAVSCCRPPGGRCR